MTLTRRVGSIYLYHSISIYVYIYIIIYIYIYIYTYIYYIYNDISLYIYNYICNFLSSCLLVTGTPPIKSAWRLPRLIEYTPSYTTGIFKAYLKQSMRCNQYVNCTSKGAPETPQVLMRLCMIVYT